MKMNMKVVLIDNGHGNNTPGKRSPDGKLLEYAWARQMASLIVRYLCESGIDARLLTPEENDIPIHVRVNRVNAICRKLGPENVTLLSVHVNAAGNGKEWKNARGFLSLVAPNAGDGSKRLARIIYDEAYKAGLKGNRSVGRERYIVKDLAICRDTKCAAVLTENLFMDNHDDCEYLLSNQGIETIARLHVDSIIKYLQK